MTNFSYYTLQQSVYQLLSGDSTLLSMVSAVYDRPPQGSAYPYVTIGESTISDWSSRNGCRKEAALIMERVYNLLHQASMSVTGQTLVQIRFVSGDILLENDGYTYQGIIRFRAFLESA